MSILVVGVSHHSAPIQLLEQAALSPQGVQELGSVVHASDHVAEALVLATCNRLEVVVEADTFHGALAEVGEALCKVTGLTGDDLMPHVYVHYDERAVSHLFSLACGLDSMAVGESQILGQLRSALSRAQEAGHLGPVLNPLLQRALKVGKRAHAETTIDQVSRSLVALGLERAARVLPDLTASRVVVLGAGAMSGLVVATLVREGIDDVTILNRTRDRADRLAELHGVRADDWSRLETLVGAADLVVTGTGALGHVVGADLLTRARTAQGRAGAPMVLLDLALPRDVDPEVARLAGVRLWGLAELDEELDRARAEGETTDDVELAVRAVREIVDGEVAEHLARRRAARLAPTIAALRTRSAQVVEAELTRLDQRLPDLLPQEREEVRQTLRRVVDKVLHTPVVRAKQGSTEIRAGDLGEAFRELFDLDPYDAAAVSAPPAAGPHLLPDHDDSARGRGSR
ncbi:glutamyl-tRNA reductase [Ornithinimicrobium panacihumi]|uniref:glutamyl-tRNA reductase n=1 Tax=Ornithinimicrobium panacihumi TaxID=2008449 RepID=UPI003F88C7D2